MNEGQVTLSFFCIFVERSLKYEFAIAFDMIELKLPIIVKVDPVYGV